MPIHDLGFRGWDGEPTPNRTRWWVIASTGIRVLWRNYWLRRMVLAAWLPALAFAFTFFAYETWIEQAAPTANDPRQIADLQDAHDELQRRMRNEAPEFRRTGMLRLFLVILPMEQTDYVQRKLLTSPNDRHFFWSYLLNTFFRYPQGVLMVLLIGIIAPPLISNDVRSKAFLLYFSRPVSLVDYVLGKMFMVWFFLLAMSTLPALCLYFLGVMLSPDFSVIFDTLDLPLRILLASIVLLVPTTTLALMLSSLTSESRFSSFAWFAVWALGGITYLIILATELPATWKGVFLIEAIGSVQTWIFLPELTDSTQVLASMIILVGITVFSLLVLMRRVSAPIRV